MGGFVGLCEHAVTFTNCRSSAVVTSTSTGSSSGFVGWSRASAYTIAFEGCLFDGKVLQKNGVGSGTIAGGYESIFGQHNDATIPASYQGIFGLTNGATIHGLRLADTYSPAPIYESGGKHNLYLGSGNTLYYPIAEDFQVNPFRAYFRLKHGLVAGEASSDSRAIRAFVLNIDEEATGIVEVEADAEVDADLKSASRESGISNPLQREWHTLDGKPTRSGLYISGGKKVYVK